MDGTPSGDISAPAPVQDAASIVKNLTPLTQQTMQSMGINAMPSAVSMEGNLSWFDRNQRKDETGKVIPIDVERGINLGDFARIVWQRRPEERMAVLRKMFPNQMVRVADTGEPIVEIAGPGGQKKDVLVNPPGFNAADLVEVGGSAPELVGGAIGMGLGQAGGAAVGGPPGAFIGRIAGAASGAAIGGIIKDVGARTAEGLPLDFREIEQSRSKEAELNALFDLGMSGGAKALRVFSPFAGERGPLEFNLQKGVDYFKRVHGENFETTPGEMAGSGPGAQFLRRVEATEAPQPGASTILGGIQSRGEAAISRVFNAAIGKRVPEEQLGNDLLNTMRSGITQPVEDAVTQARNDLVKRGETELVNTIDALAPGRATRNQAGEAIRSEFQSAQQLAKSRVDNAYATVRSIPGGSGKVLPADAVANAADRIAKELPNVGGNVLSSSRPDTLMTFLKDMQSQRGQKMSLDELTKLKNAAYDEIKKTEAVPEVRDRWFGMVADAYDKAIDSGIASVADKRLKGALTVARQTYKDALLPLDRHGLSDILRTPFESGYQAPEQLVSRLFSGVRAEHNYRVLQETLGAKSPAFNKIRSSLLNSWLSDAGDEITGRINPAKLEESFKALKSAHPEIYKDVVGGSEQKLFQTMRSIKAAGGELADMDQRELSALMTRGNPTRVELENLAKAQRDRDITLANSALKSVSESGTLGTTSPTDFINSLYNTSLPTANLKKALGALSPAQIEDLQTATLYRILTKASTFKSEYAPAFIEGTQSGISGKGLVNALGAPGSLERARNELLLGPKWKELVENGISVLSPREIKQGGGTFGRAGSMSATMTINKLLDMPFKYAALFTRKALIAMVYTSRPAKALLLNEVVGPKETAALANMLIASEPFLRKLNDTVGSDAAYSIVKDAKASIDKSLVQDTQPSQGEAQRGELLNFLRERKGKVKMQTVP